MLTIAQEKLRFGLRQNNITWRGIEILHRDGGAPYVRLSDEAKKLAERLGITDWFISISYTDELAMASVIAVGD